jgi:hypothetical protein
LGVVILSRIEIAKVSNTIQKEGMPTMKNISFLMITIALVLTVGLVYAGEPSKGLNNGVTDFTEFNADPGNSSCMSGSGAGGFAANVSSTGNGITVYSIGPATFDAGPVGPDTGGSCVKSSPITD